MGRVKSSHSGRANFNYALKQILKSKKFIILETKNGIIIKSIEFNNMLNSQINNKNKNKNKNKNAKIKPNRNNKKNNKINNKPINDINTINNKKNNNQYIFHRDSNKLHELRRWLKRNYQFELLLKH